MAIEIVDFPIKNGGSFHSYVNVYQMVSLIQHSRSKVHFFWSMLSMMFITFHNFLLFHIRSEFLCIPHT